MKKIKNLIESIKLFFFKVITRFTKKKIELGTYSNGIKIDEFKLKRIMEERGL